MIEDNKISDKSMFQIPENYFDKLGNEIETRISEERISDSFGKELPFVVPENYFKKLPDLLSNKISGKKLSIIQIIKPYLSIAAGLFIVFGVWQIFLTNFESKNITSERNVISKNIIEKPISVDSLLSDTTIQNSVTDDIAYDFDDELIASVIYDKTTDDANSESYDATVEYLADYSDDVSDLDY